MNQIIFPSMKEYPRNTQLFNGSFCPFLNHQVHHFSHLLNFIVYNFGDGKILLLVFIWKKNDKPRKRNRPTRLKVHVVSLTDSVQSITTIKAPAFMLLMFLFLTQSVFAFSKMAILKVRFEKWMCVPG